MKINSLTTCQIKSISVKVGDPVSAGSEVAVANVMKMDQSIRSPVDGVVSSVLVAVNAIVPAKTTLMIITPRSQRDKPTSDASAALAKPSPAPPSTPGWTAEMAEVRRLQALSLGLGGPANVTRQHEQGKLTCRERIGRFLDENSFREVGSITGSFLDKQKTSWEPANCVGGLGRVVGRPVVVSADDFTLRGGHSGPHELAFKAAYMEALALKYKIPLVRMHDGSSGGGSVKMLTEMKSTYVPLLPGFTDSIALLDVAPVCSLLLGPIVGLGAARAMLAHFRVMVKTISSLFVAGPPVVAYATHEKVTKEELGGWEMCATNGEVDWVAESEDEAFCVVREWLSYFPDDKQDRSSCHPFDESRTAGAGLINVIPRTRSQSYLMREDIIQQIVDNNVFFETGKLFGPSAICGFGRLFGHTVGIIASDSAHYGGALSAQACAKISRHVRLCSQFNIHILNLIDCPGFVVGTQAERDATIMAGGQMIETLFRATKRIHFCNVIVRNCFGVGGGGLAMSGLPKTTLVAWPSAQWGSLPLEGGVEAAYARQLKESNNPTELRNQIMKEIEPFSSPILTANRFGVPEIIDPSSTRKYLGEFFIACLYRSLKLAKL